MIPRRSPPPPPTRIRRLLRIVKRLVLAGILVLFLAAALSALFIGVRCYSGSSYLRQMAPELERATAGISGYSREAASTFLTLPEWYIVYNTEEYARFIGTRNPSSFPYGDSIWQYWRYYGGVCDATKGVYPFRGGNHMMLGVIGSSFTIEYAIKGLYENSFGRLTEWISGRDTPEDAFAHRTAVEYGAFMHTVPWYRFPFGAKLAQLWRETPLTGPRFVRKWERKLALSAEYAVKGVYGSLIGLGTGATYGEEDLRIHARIDNAGDAVFADGVVRKVKVLGPRTFVVTIPRFEAFTGRARLLIAQGVRFLDIAGNDEIVVTVLSSTSLSSDSSASVVLDEPVLTEANTRRIALQVPVRSLHEVVPRLEKSGARLEHIYDY